jgi:hypothetical protein
MAGRGRHVGTTKRRRGRSAVPGGEQWRWPSGLKWTPGRGWRRAERHARSREQEPSKQRMVERPLVSSHTSNKSNVIPNWP